MPGKSLSQYVPYVGTYFPVGHIITAMVAETWYFTAPFPCRRVDNARLAITLTPSGTAGGAFYLKLAFGFERTDEDWFSRHGGVLAGVIGHDVALKLNEDGNPQYWTCAPPVREGYLWAKAGFCHTSTDTYSTKADLPAGGGFWRDPYGFSLPDGGEGWDEIDEDP